jgi:hypothetical protein
MCGVSAVEVGVPDRPISDGDHAGWLKRRHPMAAQLKLYCPPPEEEPVNLPEPDVRIRLGDLLPLMAVAQRMNYVWLKDFLDDEVAVSGDLYDVMQAFRFGGGKPTSA